MRIRVQDTIDDLERDTRRIATTARADMARVVRSRAIEGNRLARGFARHSAGAHGKHYPKAFSAERFAPLVWEYGPDASRPQGGMSFEFGSRNQPPHLDLAHSADIVGPAFARDVDDLADGWFW